MLLTSAASTEPTEQTTHINNVEALASDMFDELIAPVVAAKEQTLTKLRMATMKRMVTKLAKAELMSHDTASSQLCVRTVGNVVCMCAAAYGITTL